MKLHFSRESKHCARRGLSNKGFHQKGHIFSRPNPCFRSCPVPCWRNSDSAVVAPAPQPLPPPQMTSSASCLPWRPTLWSPGWPGRGLDPLLPKELNGRWVCTGGGQTSGPWTPPPKPEFFFSIALHWRGLCPRCFFSERGRESGFPPPSSSLVNPPAFTDVSSSKLSHTLAYLVQLVFCIYSEENFPDFLRHAFFEESLQFLHYLRLGDQKGKSSHVTNLGGIKELPGFPSLPWGV